MPADPSKALKLSISVSSEMAEFLDEQCVVFGMGRSAYIQMLLAAEQHEPRKEFVKRHKKRSAN